MAVPQSGIFAVGTPAHSYLEFDLRHDADPIDLVRAVVGLKAPRTSMGRGEHGHRIPPGAVGGGGARADADLRDHGTYFVGFSRDKRRLDLMLRSMLGVDDHIRCALTRYTFPLTGAYYAVPSVDALAAFVPEDEE